jgi:ribonuclease Z
MRICFLGTASAEPTAQDGYTSFLLEAGSHLVLVDASGNPVQSLLRAGRDPLSLDILVLTHHHADHLGGYSSLVQSSSCLGRKRPLAVLCAESCRTRVRGLHELLDLDPPHCEFAVDLAESYKAPDLELRLLPGNHSVPTSMVRAADGEGCLLYTSDTAAGPAVAEAARGCGVLIHEATFPEAQAGDPAHAGHSSALSAGKAAAEAGVARLLLCHIGWHKYPHPAAVAREARRAFAGKVLVPRPCQHDSLQAGPNRSRPSMTRRRTCQMIPTLGISTHSSVLCTP